jgi:hypothetical protein
MNHGRKLEMRVSQLLQKTIRSSQIELYFGVIEAIHMLENGLELRLDGRVG